MALLWVLAIIVFFTVSGRLNKAASKDYDRKFRAEIEKQNADYQEFCNKCKDDEIEHFARIDSNDPEKYTELRKVLCEVTGREPTRKMVYLAIMATQGKIPYDVIKTGIWCYPGGGDDRYVVNQNWKSVRKFLLWYDQTLRQHGVEESLLFLGHNNECSGTLSDRKMEYVIPVDDLPLDYASGVCFWKSSRTWVSSISGISLILWDR